MTDRPSAQLDLALQSRLRLRHLALIVRIARLHTLSRVAADMHMGQPAITRALKEVEEIFGAELFERSPRGLVPTATGEAVVAYAVKALADVGTTAQQLAAIQAGFRGRVRLGVIPHAPDELLQAALAQPLTLVPPIAVSVREALTDELAAALASHELDIAIGRSMNPGHDGDVLQEPIFNQRPCILVSSQAHDRLAKRPLDWALLSDMQWILQPPTTPVRRSVQAIFSSAGVAAPAPVVETFSIRATENAFRMLPNGITIVACDLGERLAATGACRILPHAVEWRLPPICLLMPRTGDAAPAVRQVAQAIRAAAEGLARAERVQVGEF